MEIFLTDDQEEEEVKKQIWFCDKCGKKIENVSKDEIAEFEKEYCKRNGTHSIISREVSANRIVSF